MFEKLIRAPSSTDGWCCWRSLVWLPSACSTTKSYLSMPSRTSPTSKCRSTPKRRDIHRLETEQRVTIPIETVMAGLPNLEQTRSLSRYGLSQVTCDLQRTAPTSTLRASWSMNIQEARDKLPRHHACDGADIDRPGRDLPLDGRGEGRCEKPDGQPYTATDLREIQDWIIKPQLRNVPGVTEINSIGGFAKNTNRADP